MIKIGDIYSPAYLSALFREHGFRAKDTFSQNFLIDGGVAAEIAAAARGEKVLEIGAGVGALTSRLCETCGKVVALEADLSLSPIQKETLSKYKNLEIVYVDALAADFTAFSPDSICGNLPYNITSAAVEKAVKSGAASKLVFMVQKEAGQRILAGSGQRLSCPLSIMVEYFYEGRILFEVPKESFVPAPAVSSVVLLLERRSAPPTPVNDCEKFFSFVCLAFSLRRKTILNCLSAKFSKEAIRAALSAAGLSETARAEELNITKFALLSNILM